ncbi:hypothetical protein PIB30_090636 [Stylosanthes scabra]|uniref:Uncharacterized protein n=1 Tax=Stylosanthes scabra TaxID=79078 RepID=A0ABU6UXZ8_9FABA|nr:hypothetical protein [Stylosanthes scabra]
MDELGHAQEEIKEEMNQMKEQIVKILESLQAISTNGIPETIGGERTNVPQYLPNVASQGIITPHTMNQGFPTSMPIYGLPPGYVPPVAITYSGNVATTQNIISTIHPNAETSQCFPNNPLEGSATMGIHTQNMITSSGIMAPFSQSKEKLDILEERLRAI